MPQFQNSARRIWSMPETLEHGGVIYTLVMKGSDIENNIRNYRYDHPGVKYIVKCPNGDGFSYFYVVLP